MRCRYKVTQIITAAALTAIMTISTAFAAVGTATVTADSLRLRSAASTSSSILTSAPKGATVSLLSGNENGWYKVSYKNKEGYMSADWLNATLFSTASIDLPSAETVPVTDTAGSSSDSKAELTTSVVTADLANIRSGPGASYTLLAQLKKGDQVTLLEHSNNTWIKVSVNGVEGYAYSKYISKSGSLERKGMITASTLNVRTGPGTGYTRIGSLKIGTSVTILDTVNGWHKITTGSIEGYVSGSYVIELEDVGSSSIGSAAAALAVSLVGSRYVYGASGPTTFDCSGLSYYIFKQLGRTLSRGSSGQYNNNGSFVAASDVEPGDLVFFFDPKFDSSRGTLPTTHMGICVGNGQFIHASTATYRVQYDDLYGSYYTPYIVGFKRIV